MCSSSSQWSCSDAVRGLEVGNGPFAPGGRKTAARLCAERSARGRDHYLATGLGHRRMESGVPVAAMPFETHASRVLLSARSFLSSSGGASKNERLEGAGCHPLGVRTLADPALVAENRPDQSNLAEVLSHNRPAKTVRYDQGGRGKRRKLTMEGEHFVKSLSSNRIQEGQPPHTKPPSTLRRPAAASERPQAVSAIYERNSPAACNP